MKRSLQATFKNHCVRQMLQNIQTHTAVLLLRKFFYTSSLEAHITYVFLNMYWDEKVHLVRYIYCKNTTQDFLLNSLNCGNHYYHQTQDIPITSKASLCSLESATCFLSQCLSFFFTFHVNVIIHCVIFLGLVSLI